MGVVFWLAAALAAPAWEDVPAEGVDVGLFTALTLQEFHVLEVCRQRWGAPTRRPACPTVAPPSGEFDEPACASGRAILRACEPACEQPNVCATQGGFREVYAAVVPHCVPRVNGEP